MKLDWNTRALQVADLDGDGLVDLAVANNDRSAIEILHQLKPGMPVDSLPRSVRTNRWEPVLDKVREHLVTPVGLRSLSTSHAAYRPTYDGDLRARDAAYHQGTVWPWLLGPMISAYVRAEGGGEDVRRLARTFLAGLEAHLGEYGMGGICEVADGDPPHRPDGCPWQAWSVAEPLRALCEELR